MYLRHKKPLSELDLFLEQVCHEIEAYKPFKSAELIDFPISRKQDLIGNANRHISTAIPQSEQTELLKVIEKLECAPPTTNYRTSANNYIIERSSGTTGPCLYLPRTHAECIQGMLIANRARLRINNQFRSSRFCDLVSIINSQTFTANLDIMALLSGHILKKASSGHVYGSASMFTALASRLSDEKITPSIQMAEVGGEFPDKIRLEVLSARLNAPFISQYACREVWSIGYDSVLNNKYSLNDGVIVEILDDTGTPISAAGEKGDIVVTSLVFKLYPIIRFRTGDRGSWHGSFDQQTLSLDDERTHAGIMLPNGRVTSATMIMKNVLQATHPQIKGAWKVRRNGSQFRIYLVRSDLCHSDRVREKMRQALFWINPQVEIEEWSGWEPLEKQILYVDQSRA